MSSNNEFNIPHMSKLWITPEMISLEVEAGLPPSTGELGIYAS
jgi:hypothetical protein